MVAIRVPTVLVSWGITPNSTRTITPTTSRTVNSKLRGLANFLARLLPRSLAFPKSCSSRKLMGTLIIKAMAPPSTKGNRMPQIPFSTPITASIFHSATTNSAENTMSSRTLLRVSSLKFIVRLLSLKPKRGPYCTPECNKSLTIPLRPRMLPPS